MNSRVILWERFAVSLDYRAVGNTDLNNKTHLSSIYTLLVCMLVSLYPINVQTAKPIGPKFCVGLHLSPRKVYWLSKFQKLPPAKIRFPLNLKIPPKMFIKSANFVLGLFYNEYKEKLFTIEIVDGCEAF